MAMGLNEVESIGLRGMYSTAQLRERIESANKAFAIGGVLIVLQALDGILTSLGVSRYGVDVEGNPLLRSLMAQFGHVQILGLVKLLAVLFILALVYYAKQLPWVRGAMGAIGCVYLFAAILPWTYVLFFTA